MVKRAPTFTCRWCDAPHCTSGAEMPFVEGDRRVCSLCYSWMLELRETFSDEILQEMMEKRDPELLPPARRKQE